MITQHCRIGRNLGNDLVINDRAAEDFHAVIMLSDDNLIFIEDQSSRYGTLVNGERISKVQLFPGDEVQIGFCRIDWENRTGFLPTLNEIEVIPNLSVPIKRPIQHNAALADTQSSPHLNQLNKGDASLALANSLLENESQLDRIDNTIHHDELVETSQTINETTIQSEDSFNEMIFDSQSEKEIEELNSSEINQDTSFIPNHSVHQPIIESNNEEVDYINVGKIENESSDNLILELNQGIHQVEAPIEIETENQSNGLPTASGSSDELNVPTPLIYFKNNDVVKNYEDTLIDSPKKNTATQKSNLFRKDSIQILLAIALTFLLLTAGWLIGQAS